METIMGATPNFGTDDVSGLNTGSGIGASSSNSYTDDVSFNRGGSGTQSTHDGAASTRNVMESGVDKAHDTIGQLQQKASEITARLVDNINVEDITQKLEAQVREHPARTLLLAAGAGFLLGRTMTSKK